LLSKLTGYRTFDADYDDGKYCNVVKRCVGNVCVAGSSPCGVSDSDTIGSCSEAAKDCVSSPRIACGFGTEKICP